MGLVLIDSILIIGFSMSGYFIHKTFGDGFVIGCFAAIMFNLFVTIEICGKDDKTKSFLLSNWFRRRDNGSS